MSEKTVVYANGIRLIRIFQIAAGPVKTDRAFFVESNHSHWLNEDGELTEW